MNDLELLREHGPDAPPVSLAALSSARQRLMAEMAPAAPARRRWGWSRVSWAPQHRRVGLGFAVAVVVAAAAGGTFMLSEHRASTGRSTGVQLVAFDSPVYPIGLRPRPAGLAAPTFSGGVARDEQGNDRPVMTAVFRAADGVSDVYLGVSDRYVPQDAPERVRSVSLQGVPGFVVEHDAQSGTSVVLSWQRRPGQWVTLTGHGRFGNEAAVRALAATVADDAQPVPLQVRLAPAGWRLVAFKDNKIVTLRAPDSVEELIVNLVKAPERDLMGWVSGAKRVSTVQVNGRESHLVQTIDGWFLQVPLPDGTAFHLQAPAMLTGEQVVAVGAQVVVTSHAR
ncbi:hypothetical protein C1A38_16405 [Verrucosispora sp. ts21]|uniref:hypothetical protein n=1 Tax=Verrucosispora sp. ts21 TaxID=2069341 RepID=UPI000C88D793|nr:hypothetical protein [Verrucosispora sp. ts21]PMR60003.1 hypothetical protein C1A38_16405 [Verrucosispora sp. ts21]